MAARVSIRKMGTRAGRPHYGAECMTCHTVLIPFGRDREVCVAAREEHKKNGCTPTLAWATNAHDFAPLRDPRS